MNKKRKKQKITQKKRKISQKRRVIKRIQKKKVKKISLGAISIEELIKRGRSRRFVTQDEILKYFPKVEENIDLLEKIYDS
ncbi:hypothetical protein GW901_00980, partial [Candidatus Parcubacteria bacterium]|nr:hypothetical protein [Candidatus Parcubacteria bacterium]